MSLSGIVKSIKKHGFKVTIAKIPLGRRPELVEHKFYDPLDRAVILSFFRRILKWLDTLEDQSTKPIDVNEIDKLRNEICAMESRLLSRRP